MVTEASASFHSPLMSDEDKDPHLSNSELELSNLLASSQHRAAAGSSKSLARSIKVPLFVRILAILFAFVVLLIKFDIKADTQLLFHAQDEEEKGRKRTEHEGIIAPGSPNWLQMRWQLDTTVQDNCIPGFRLANNTNNLTCGISVAGSDVHYLTQRHGGSTYCAGVQFDPDTCIEPMSGYWSLPSNVNLDQSDLPPLPYRLGMGTYDSTKLLPRCKTMDEYLANGTIVSRPDVLAEASSWAEYDQEYVPSNCSSVPLNPFIWTEHSSCQTTITMYGDSHIRNLFTATVFGLRGAEYFAEAHADSASKSSGIIYSYEWRMHKDGTADDFFEFHSGTNFKNSTYKVSHCSCRDNVERCLRIFFVWAPLFQEQLNTFHHVKEWETDLLIVEPGNSYEHTAILSDEWKIELDNMLQEDEDLRLGILHFPWGNHPAKERTEALKEWVSSSSHADRMAYMRQDDITFTPGLQGQATFHFACGLSQVNVKNDKIDAAEPCTDRMDTSQIRALTTVLFGAFENAKR